MFQKRFSYPSFVGLRWLKCFSNSAIIVISTSPLSINGGEGRRGALDGHPWCIIAVTPLLSISRRQFCSVHIRTETYKEARLINLYPLKMQHGPKASQTKNKRKEKCSLVSTLLLISLSTPRVMRGVAVLV